MAGGVGGSRFGARLPNLCRMEIIELRSRLYLVWVEFGRLYLWRGGDALTEAE